MENLFGCTALAPSIRTSIQCSDLAAFHRRKSKENISQIITHWCQDIDKCSIPTLYSNILPFMMHPLAFSTCWSLQHKSSFIRLSNNNSSAIIHQKAFRKHKRDSNEIDFVGLSKTHYIQSTQHVPYKTKNGSVSSVSISLEIYEHFVDQNLDKNDCALHGTHKIGIVSDTYDPKTKKKYFIGLSSTYNQHSHRKSIVSSTYRNKEQGVLCAVGIDGKKKFIRDGIAFRKFETITMTVDWINKVLLFKRHKQHQSTGERSKHESVICVSLEDSMNITKMQWFTCCAMCLNQTDSFMWNHKIDDFIRITLIPGEML